MHTIPAQGKFSTRRSALAGLFSALGCAAGAHAQTSVSVYGLLDMNAGVVSDFGADGGSAVRVSSGGMNTSRLGFRGSEDLGNGLRAVFQLEAGLLLDTGGADTPLFKRQANVGLEGRWGRLVVGRSFTTTYDFLIGYDPMGYAPFYSWGPSGSATGASRYGMATAFDNMLKYKGKFDNFTLGASYGAGEQAAGSANGAKAALALDYTAGPWSVVAAWDRINGNGVAATGRRDATTSRHVGAMYKAGSLKLQAAMRDYRMEAGRDGVPDLRARLYWAGANYLLTPADTLTGAVYYQDVRNLAPGLDADPVMLVARLRHALSKRTDLYLSAAWTKAKHGRLIGLSRDDPGFADTQRGIVAGIQHRF